MVVSNKSYFTGNANPVSFSKTNYWLKRIARIYPSYLLAFFLVLLFNYTIKVIYPSIATRSIFEVLGIQRWLYGGSINFPAWTVSTEFFFYLLFPYTITWLSKSPLKKVAATIIVFFVVSVTITSVIGFVFANRQVSKTDVMLIGAVYRHPIFEYAVFLFGNLCGICYIRNLHFGITQRRVYATLCLASLLCICMLVYFLSMQNPLIIGGIICPLYFVFVISLCRLQGKTLTLMSSPVFIFLGDISYSIYIFQIPVFLFYNYYTGSSNVGLAFTSITGFLIFSIVLTGFCSINYFIYEMPLKNFIIKQYKRHNTKHIPAPRGAFK